MATVAQLKSLIRTHFSSNPEAFSTLVLQIAAQEARQGRSSVATEIRDLLDQQRASNTPAKPFFLPEQMEEFVRFESPDVSQAQLVVSESIQKRLEKIILEYRLQNKLKCNGFSNRRKILLHGAPGTGKTMTAKVLAHELHLPLLNIRVDRIMSKYLGESSAHLRKIFEFMKNNTAVYLFDEFDAIGGERSKDNDIGEMRRVLNAFLTLMDQDTSDSLIIAATNNPRLLDQALCRRFDDVLLYTLPDKELRKNIILNLLTPYVGKSFNWESIVNSCDNLSQAEITLACNDAIKEMLLEDKSTLSEQKIIESIDYRKEAKSTLN